VIRCRHSSTYLHLFEVEQCRFVEKGIRRETRLEKLLLQILFTPVLETRQIEVLANR
jgi:hypothetical protein